MQSKEAALAREVRVSFNPISLSHALNASRWSLEEHIGGSQRCLQVIGLKKVRNRLFGDVEVHAPPFLCSNIIVVQWREAEEHRY